MTVNKITNAPTQNELIDKVNEVIDGLGSTVSSVNSITPDNNGNVTLTASDIGSQPAGNYVTTDTTQTISGVKTHTGAVHFIGSGDNNAVFLSTNTRFDVEGTTKTVLGFGNNLFYINHSSYDLQLRGSGTRPKYNSSSYLALTSDIPDDTSDLTNGAGFITGIDSSDVINALDYTPQPELVSGTNIKTINNQSLLGSGNINISSSGTPSLDDLTDVTITNLSSGQILSYDGSSWVNENKSSEIFVAEYNVTSYTDIKNAYDAGKTIYCKYGDGNPSYEYYPLTMMSSVISFSGINGLSSDIITVYQNTEESEPYPTVWSINIYSLQNSSNAVTIADSAPVGSTTQPVYVNSSGEVASCNYSLNKSVPSDAVFTDTTYSVFTGADGTSAGTSGLVPQPSSSDNTKFLKGNGTWATVDSFPTQTGNSGKFLTTNGTTASWASIPTEIPTQTGNSGKFLTTNGTMASWATLSIPSKISDLTDDTATYPVDKADTLTGLTASIAELNIMDGVTATASELNILDGVTATTTELNYVDGVTSAIQTQLDNKLAKKPDGTHDLVDSNNKINTTYIPDVVLGQMLYAGTFVPSTGLATLSTNAKTILGTTSNTITLTNDTTAITGYVANEGNYYIASADGTFASISFLVGDWLLSTGSGWTKVSNTDAVTGVKGNAESTYRTGNINITADNVLPTQTNNSGKFLTTDGTTASWATVDALPTQTGNTGKYLTTNGTTASWASVDLLPSQSGNSGKFLTTDGTNTSWGDAIINTATGSDSLTIEGTATSSTSAVNIGKASTSGGGYSVALGYYSASNGARSTSIGYGARIGASTPDAIQIGNGTNSNSKTLSVGFYNTANYELLDGTTGLIPDERISDSIARTTSQTIETLSSGAITLSRTKSIYSITVNGSDVTFTFNESNLSLTNSEAFTFELCIKMETVQTLSFPASVVWQNNVTPLLNATGTYFLVFRTINSGTTWFGNLQGVW